MIEHGQKAPTRKHPKRPEWTSDDLNLLTYVVKEDPTPSSQPYGGQHFPNRPHNAGNDDDTRCITILAKNSTSLSRLCALATLLEQRSCIEHIW